MKLKKEEIKSLLKELRLMIKGLPLGAETVRGRSKAAIKRRILNEFFPYD